VYGFLLLLATAVVALSPNAFGQGKPDPAYAHLEKAYDALKRNEFEPAVEAFRKAVAASPNRPDIRKDLAYTLLKIGEAEASRDQFAEAARLDPQDTQAALEYAFLCYETRQPVQARRTFDRLRRTGNLTAAEAFENIDRPLREGIERWKQALARSPENFSGHEELARLAEERDEFTLAAEHFEKAWHLKPERRDLLLALGRIWKEQKRDAESYTALLAASRSAEPRVAEQARELLPSRYPYASEFEKALELDPTNVELRRELAYLLLQVNQNREAERQFEKVLQAAPDDLLSLAQLGLMLQARGETAAAVPMLEKVLAGGDAELAERVRTALRAASPTLRNRMDEMSPLRPADGAATSADDNAKKMAEASLEKGYLKDAVKYLNLAHENDPLDFDVMLKLGRTYNILKDDQTAVRWFSLARKSPDPKTAAEASRAYRNLASSASRFRTTLWAFPIFSTRWHDAFIYSQVKTEMKLPDTHAAFQWIRPYASVRFVGDFHDAVRPALGLAPQYLSEQSAIMALGLTTPAWHRATAWFEAGEAFKFRPAPLSTSFAVPDYRGGVSYSRGWGEQGRYAETNDDLVYVHRFERDTLAYSQNRFGYRMQRVQLYWNANLTTDFKHLYWANYAETGPGMKFHLGSLPFLFSVDAVHGMYLVNENNPRAPQFNDLRIGLWYGFTR
jgi:Tfp pilus assembly protein PilF